MVTFTPRLSHARFGQQQQAAVNSAQLLSIPGFSGNGDQASFSHSKSASQVQFGGIPLRGRRALAGGAAILALLLGGVACGTSGTTGSNGKTDTTTSASAVPGSSSSKGTSSNKEVTIEQAIELLQAYSETTKYRFPTSAELEKVRSESGSVVNPKEAAMRIQLQQEELPRFMLWLLGYEDPNNPQAPRVHPDAKGALPWQVVQNKDKTAADPMTPFVAQQQVNLYKYLSGEKEDEFRAIVENTVSLKQPLRRAEKPIGLLLPDDKRLVDTTESREIYASLFMIYTSVGPEKFKELVSNPKLAGKGNALIQYYDFSVAPEIKTTAKITKDDANVLNNVRRIFKETGLTVLMADPNKLSGKLSDDDIKKIGETGKHGDGNYVTYVDTAKTKGDLGVSAASILTGWKLVGIQ